MVSAFPKVADLFLTAQRGCVAEKADPRLNVYSSAQTLFRETLTSQRLCSYGPSNFLLNGRVCIKFLVLKALRQFFTCFGSLGVERTIHHN
jgi:hypothetical protein